MSDNFNSYGMILIRSNVDIGLPPGTKVVGITPHALSYWTRTAKIKTLQPDGSELSIFLEVDLQKRSF
jgi:protein-ribulosamine 3-kinase